MVNFLTYEDYGDRRIRVAVPGAGSQRGYTNPLLYPKLHVGKDFSDYATKLITILRRVDLFGACEGPTEAISGA